MQARGVGWGSGVAKRRALSRGGAVGDGHRCHPAWRSPLGWGASGQIRSLAFVRVCPPPAWGGGAPLAFDCFRLCILSLGIC